MTDEDEVIVLGDDLDDPLLLQEDEQGVEELGQENDEYYKGDPGKSVELQVANSYVQYRLIGNVNWINLIALADITGNDGKSVELQNDGTNIKWRLVGNENWIQLIALSALVGATGRGISGTSYNAGTGVLTIAYTDNTSYSTGDLRGAAGKSAYQSYVDTTTDNPKLEEQEWSNQLAGVLTILNSI